MMPNSCCSTGCCMANCCLSVSCVFFLIQQLLGQQLYFPSLSKWAQPGLEESLRVTKKKCSLWGGNLDSGVLYLYLS